jgi:hypothetical protein
MSPRLEGALLHLEKGEREAARIALRDVAANPIVHAPGEWDQRVFSVTCELAALPEDFPARILAQLANGVRTETFADALARVRDPLGEDPDSAPARLALLRHSPILSRAVEGTPLRVPVQADPEPPRPAGRFGGTNGWLLIALVIALGRACTLVG